MKDKLLFYKYFKELNKENKDYMMEQSIESLEYNINAIKNEILKNVGEKNEK